MIGEEMKVPEKISEEFPTMAVKLSDKEVKNLGKSKFRKNPKAIQLLLTKVRNVYKSKFEKSMNAITFAEAGEYNIARNILNDKL